MFSFHKPKIYRSNLGCCICKAKSSSSRFTDSKKYENEFERCFRIQEKRSGEICNACVLLVKRWKKLSPDNKLVKHWHHVVDARAGPGTKLTGNRRITSHNSSQHHQQSSGDSSGSSNQSRSQKSSQANKNDVLPLTSSQANNQSSATNSGATRVRASSLSKARAIDTNVSTFTFGEPHSIYRRSYMTNDPSANHSTYSSASSSPLSKPQSALNSSAFESVIKRFRQRQQQQHLEAQRRLLSRQERQRSRQLNLPPTTEPSSISNQSKLPNNPDNADSEQDKDSNPNQTNNSPVLSKRIKRSSENYGSLTSLDTLKISSVLDSSIWRKEKICCGIIFRGLHNEVAVIPSLLRPCDYRPMLNLGEESSNDQSVRKTPADVTDSLVKNSRKRASPPPRASKSGSISSCDSSTSGTGSMEPSLEDIKRSNRDKNDLSPAVRPRSVPFKRRRSYQHPKDDVESNSTSGASTISSGGKEVDVDSPSGSDHSPSGLALIEGCEADDEELVLGDDDACDSSNDASSSGESLVEVGTKKSSAVA